MRCMTIRFLNEVDFMNDTKPSALSRTPVVAALALVCCLLWGSAFPGVKTGYALMEIDSGDWPSQMVFAGIRFFLAGIMALLIGSAAERRILLPRKSAVPKILRLSLFQTILQYFFYYIGLAHTTGTKAAIIVAANTFFAILLSSLVFRQEELTGRKLLGCLLGFAGIVLVNLGGLQEGLHFSPLGDGFVLLCTLASAVSSVLMKHDSATESPVLLSGWQFVFGGAVMWIFGAVCGGTAGRITPASAAMLVYLSFVSAAAYSLWAVLLRHNPVSKVAVFGFLNPMCGVILSGIFLHESGVFSLQSAAALALVCLGIVIVNVCGKKRNAPCTSDQNML